MTTRIPDDDIGSMLSQAARAFSCPAGVRQAIREYVLSKGNSPSLDDSIIPQDPAQPPVRLVPDVPTDPADGVSRVGHPIAQPPGRRHVSRRIITMFQRKAVRWSVVAAAIALLVGLLWTPSGSRNPRSAFAQLVQANRNYRGWIHAKMDQVPQAMQRHDAPRVIGTSIHVNAEKKILVKVIEFESGRTVEWRDGGQRSCQSYSSGNNELVACEWGDRSDIEQVRQELKAGKDFTPWQLAQFLLVDPTVDGLASLVDYGCSVTQQDEGVAQRFDLTLPGYTGPDAPRAGQPFLTVLFDKQTQLIQHWFGTFDGMAVAFSFSYGAPDFQTIRDLDVPSDAKWVDRRETAGADAQALLARLDARIGVNETLGDYVAIETETRVTPSKDSSQESVAIFARSGDKRFFGRYWNLPQSQLDLQGWPTPGMTLVRSARGVLPDILFISDGTQGWWGRSGSRSRSLTAAEVREHYLSGFSLSSTIWPGSQRIDYQHRPRLGIELQTLPDTPQSGLKVIESGWTGIMPGADFDVVEYEWHIDPARDDVPVTLLQRNRAKSGEVTMEVQTEYLDYAQLPTGRFYPTRWLVKVVVGTVGNKMKTTEHRLQIFPGQELDPVWYADPSRFPAKP